MRVLHEYLQILVYAADDAIGRYKRTVEERCIKGLTINREKAKFWNNTNEKHITIGNRNMEIDNFEYPGSIVTCNNNINMGINGRMKMGHRCHYGLQDLLRSKLSLRKILNIELVVFYGSES
jgi:hypothetical protein